MPANFANALVCAFAVLCGALPMILLVPIDCDANATRAFTVSLWRDVVYMESFSALSLGIRGLLVTHTLGLQYCFFDAVWRLCEQMSAGSDEATSEALSLASECGVLLMQG